MRACIHTSCLINFAVFTDNDEMWDLPRGLVIHKVLSTCICVSKFSTGISACIMYPGLKLDLVALSYMCIHGYIHISLHAINSNIACIQHHSVAVLMCYLVDFLTTLIHTCVYS